MPVNIEIKARIREFEPLKVKVSRLSDTPGEILNQEDVFFNLPAGRLKLRFLTLERGELIYYEREDTSGPKKSDYIIYPTSEPASLKSVLAKSLGIRGVIRKQRFLYWIGQTRIHLDRVEGLGEFIEFEVALKDGEEPRIGEKIARELMEKLGIGAGDLLEGAYIDLLEAMK